MFIKERVLNMRMTESKLRRIIRSVIAESIESEYKPVLAENEIIKFVSYIVRFCEVRDKEELDLVAHNMRYRGTKAGKSEEEIESEIAAVWEEDMEEAIKELSGVINGQYEMLGVNRDIETWCDPYELLKHLKGKDLTGIVKWINTHTGTKAPFGTYTVQKDLLKALGFDNQKIDSLKKDAMYYRKIYDMDVKFRGYIRSFSDAANALKFSFDWGKQVNDEREQSK